MNARPLFTTALSPRRQVNLIPKAAKAAAMSGTIGPSCASQLLGRLSSGELFAIFRLIFLEFAPFPFRRAKGVAAAAAAVRSPKI